MALMPDDTTAPVTAEGSYDWWRTEVAARDAELERLRAELAEAQRERDFILEVLPDLDTHVKLFDSDDPCVDWCPACLRAKRDALRSAIETLSARHQPTVAKNLIRCDRHVNMRRVSWEELRDCSDCRDEPITVCSNLTCCEYPCEDRKAIDAALAP